MNYKKLTIKSTKDNYNKIVGILCDFDIYDFMESEDFDLVNEEVKEESNELKMETYLSEEDYDIKEVVKSFDQYGDILVEVESTTDEAWDSDWKSFYEVLKFGDVVIQPMWEDYEPSKNEVVVKLDSGMLPKEGTHNTTRMCIDIVKKHVNPGDDVLDIGTGSGILGILAAKLGANKVKATEIDENLVFGAKENVENNELENFEIEIADCTKDEFNFMADVIIANIISPLIVQIPDKLEKSLKPNGKIIVSGIREEELEEVKKALNKFEILEIIELGEWRSMVVKGE